MRNGVAMLDRGTSMDKILFPQEMDLVFMKGIFIVDCLMEENPLLKHQ